MKNLQVLGPGCKNCKRLAENAEAAAKELGIEYTLEKVTDIQAIAAAGIMRTPGLLVDGKVKMSGRVPSVEEIKALLS
jgi:small redox-active disulfide protein 2